MTITGPTPFAAALAELRKRKLVPTSLSSADLRELEAAVRRRALFSARMTQLKPLEELQKALDEMLSGKGNMADGKLALGQVYEAMGYDAEAGGFKEDPLGTVPPARRGSLRDLASERRMELTIKTNYRLAANEAFVAKGTEDQRLYQWPAWELVRIAGRKSPRGWEERWQAAGGELFAGRMIEPKDSDVWQELGDGAGGYRDTLGNPYPPFAFGSGMGIREVSRADCISLGVIDADDAIAQLPPRLAADLRADAAGLDPALLAAFADDLESDGAGVRLRNRRFGAPPSGGSPLRNRLHALCGLINAYDPSQDRDEGGQWTDGDAGGGKKDEKAKGHGDAAPGPAPVVPMKDMMQKLKGNPKARVTADLGKISGRTGARLSKAFGEDVHGSDLEVEADAYRHSRGLHPEISDAEWQSIPAMIDDADYIIPSKERTLRGEQAVEVWKRDGTWLKLVLSKHKGRKIRVKTFKRRKELFNRRFGGCGRWGASATPLTGGGALTSKTAQTATGHNTPLHNRCKALLTLMQGGAWS